MRALLLIFSALALMGTDQPRIASTSLCADSYVLSTVPTEQIMALSWQANDPVSNTPQVLQDLPKAWDDPERLLALNPDLVVFGPGEGRLSKPFLDKAGIRHVTLIWGEDFKAVKTNHTALAAAARIKFPTHALPASVSRHPVSVLYLTRAGGTAGPGTYVDAVIRAAGGTNIITTPGWHTPELETLLPLKPDLIVTSFFEDGYASTNENGLRHSLLRNKINTVPHINIPGKLWPCAGPGLYEVERLVSKKITEVGGD